MWTLRITRPCCLSQNHTMPLVIFAKNCIPRKEYRMRMTSKLGSRAYTGLLILKRDEGNLRAGICFSHLPDSLSLAEIDEVLHPDEEAYYKTLEFEKRRR